MAFLEDERRVREALERSLGRELSDDEWAMVRAAKAGGGDRSKLTKESWLERHIAWLIPAAIGLIVALSELIPRFAQQLVQFASEHAFHAYGASVSLIVSAAWAWILANYMPKGHATDASHIWVDPTTHARVSGASERDVYEHYHGYGSWWNQVRDVWEVLRILGFFVAAASPPVIANIAGYRAQLLGEGSDFWDSFAVVVAGGLIYIAVLLVQEIEFRPPGGPESRLTHHAFKDLMDWQTQWLAKYWWLFFILIAALAALALSTLFLCFYYFLPAATQAGLARWYAVAFYPFWLLVFLMVIVALVTAFAESQRRR